MWITTPAFLVTLFLAAIEGIVAYSYYHTVGCDPLVSKQIRDPNQVRLRVKKYSQIIFSQSCFI